MYAEGNEILGVRSNKFKKKNLNNNNNNNNNKSDLEVSDLCDTLSLVWEQIMHATILHTIMKTML